MVGLKSGSQEPGPITAARRRRMGSMRMGCTKSRERTLSILLGRGRVAHAEHPGEHAPSSEHMERNRRPQRPQIDQKLKDLKGCVNSRVQINILVEGGRRGER